MELASGLVAEGVVIAENGLMVVEVQDATE